MKRLIDADVLLEQMQPDSKFKINSYADAVAMTIANAYIKLVENQPTIEPERKTGRWIPLSRHKWIRTHKCDQCGNILDFEGVNAGRGDANFCPNCGADMRGDKHETD